MKNEKYHFNSKDLENNIHLINEQSFSNISRNHHQYQKKYIHNYPFSNNYLNVRNQKNLNSSDQSTLLSSKDYHKKNKIISDLNNCICSCHEIDKKLINNILKILKINVNVHVMYMMTHLQVVEIILIYIIFLVIIIMIID